MAVIGILVLVVLALIFGALGKEGFNGVTKAAPNLISVGSSPSE
jgi:amino acid permease